MKQPNTEIIHLYDSVEAAAILHIGADYLRRLCREGKLSYRRRGRSYLFSAQDINDYISGEAVPALVQVATSTARLAGR